MQIIRVKDKHEGSLKAFEMIKEGIANGAKVLGLATGSTPEELYAEIRKSDLDFSEMISINLDEYVGLNEDDEQSYRTFMRQHLFDAKPFKESFVPNGKASDLEAEARHYDEIISTHPIDIQILGLGQNGHIGFNEPATPFDSTTHIVDLTESTINANKRFFDKVEDVPTKAVSMGIHSIFTAKEIILMAWGEAKADAVKAMVNGEITEEMPASILQKHENVVVIVDEEAASKL
ncbi:glucosamine-6-phosphate deaminase [Pilibacter termitis]|uniref:Glucosamine-6-phosphate deaminase n=1 Tax=Pilibacter termitis TaxID=263852 RepID=A0A1T4LJ60_9ENTE|nr:glucosamine-6-phosphate deaminase [Pilibacter termitis]SJZ54671.1 glucosamine-6-phosphate deaminase [Pilibacter termitis]